MAVAQVWKSFPKFTIERSQGKTLGAVIFREKGRELSRPFFIL